MRIMLSMDSKKAFAYLRVSGKGQVDGDGFPRQLSAIDKYADANGLKVRKVFREEGISGTKELENRPALQELLAAIDSADVKVVIIEKLDRLARDLMVQETIIGDLRKRGIELVSVAEPDLCSDDPSRKLVRQIFGAISEYEKCMIVLKLRGARQRMKARTGRCEGMKAFGEGRTEKTVVRRILELRAGGLAVDKIAAALNAEDLKPKYGVKWYGSSVSNVLKRNMLVQEVA
jgi:DNA invertase Pin-like site-specific DNA recombinase